MGVSRCVCSDISFAELLAMHRDRGLSLEELKDVTDCCNGCTACEPYVALTLETGRTDHDVLSASQAQEIMSRA